jgi:hypothetical protein
MTSPAKREVKACDLIGARKQQTFTITAATETLDGSTPASQAALNKVVETVALNGQPTAIVLGATTMTVSIEHVKAWVDAAALEAALNAMHGSAEYTVA